MQIETINMLHVCVAGSQVHLLFEQFIISSVKELPSKVFDVNTYSGLDILLFWWKTFTVCKCVQTYCKGLLRVQAPSVLPVHR